MLIVQSMEDDMASESFEKARELAKQLAEMTEEQRAQMAANMMVTTIEGHQLSVKNMALAMLQIENPTVVGGFNQWRKAGRQVSKGTKAIWIFAPSPKKDGQGNEELRFRLVPVFDVQQTEPLAEMVAA